MPDTSKLSVNLTVLVVTASGYWGLPHRNSGKYEEVCPNAEENFHPLYVTVLTTAVTVNTHANNTNNALQFCSHQSE